MHLKATDPEAGNYDAFFEGRRLDHCVEVNEEGGYVVVSGMEFSGKNWPLIDHTLSNIVHSRTHFYILKGEAKLKRIDND